MSGDTWWTRTIRRARIMMGREFSGGMGAIQTPDPRLAAALGDLLSRPGSLIRAVVAYLVGLEMGLVDEAARALGCGIEYLHTASLVFDDLPAMDDARMRRGAACLHIVHGEGVAVLAALALVNRGYSMLWRGIREAGDDRRGRAGDWVEARLGIHGVIGGQALDLAGWRHTQDAASVSRVAARKTADLLRLSLVLPAIAGRGSEREIRILDRLAILRGLAYQAADDIKDVLSLEEEFGKTAGRDRELGRPNLVSAEGLPAAVRRCRRLRICAEKAESALPGDPKRWGMLGLLAVPEPWNIAALDVSGMPAAG